MSIGQRSSIHWQSGHITGYFNYNRFISEFYKITCRGSILECHKIICNWHFYCKQFVWYASKHNFLVDKSIGKHIWKYEKYLLPKLLGWLAPMCGGWRQWCLGQFVSGSQLARTRLSGLLTLSRNNDIAFLGWTPFSMKTWETSGIQIFQHSEFRMKQCLVLLVVVGSSLGMELGRCL